MIYLRECFKNIQAGVLQSVDGMSMVPLLGDNLDDEIASPEEVEFEGTVEYGNMKYKNNSENPGIIPTNHMVISNKAAQDHAMSTGELIKSKSEGIYDNACCIQSCQSGYLDKNKNEFDILPVSLRLKLCGEKRRASKFSKLWDDIKIFNKNIPNIDRGAHLEYFFRAFKDELNEFTAEFEPVKDQIGAMIFFGPDLVGVEMVPNKKYWFQIWKLLIRGCYGAEYLRLNKIGVIKNAKLKLPNLNGCDTISSILERIDKFIWDTTKNLLLNFPDLSIDGSPRRSLKTEHLSCFDIDQHNFVGDVITRDNKPLYLSIVK